MADSRYFSKLGPIPEEWFENDIRPDREKMLKTMGQSGIDEEKAFSEMVKRVRAEKAAKEKRLADETPDNA